MLIAFHLFNELETRKGDGVALEWQASKPSDRASGSGAESLSLLMLLK